MARKLPKNKTVVFALDEATIENFDDYRLHLLDLGIVATLDETIEMSKRFGLFQEIMEWGSATDIRDAFSDRLSNELIGRSWPSYADAKEWPEWAEWFPVAFAHEAKAAGYKLTDDAEKEAAKPLIAEPGRGSGVDPRSIIIAPTRKGKGMSFIMTELLPMTRDGDDGLPFVILKDPKGPR